MILFLLACKPTYSEVTSAQGPVVVLDAETPEQRMEWSASLQAESPKVMDATLWVWFEATWEGSGALRAFYQGVELAPQPVEDTQLLSLGALGTDCVDDEVILCELSGTVTVQLLQGESVELTPVLWVEAEMGRPAEEKLEGVELVGVLE